MELSDFHRIDLLLIFSDGACIIKCTCACFFFIQRVGTQHGKVLGGGSSVGYMVYVRGHPDDFNSWEKQGCTDWGWRDVEPYYLKLEDYFLKGGDFI